MRIMTVAFALERHWCCVTLRPLLPQPMRERPKSFREPRVRLIVRVARSRPTPWDYILFHDIVIDLRTTGSIHAAGP